jgi:hypothetical protein
LHLPPDRAAILWIRRGLAVLAALVLALVAMPALAAVTVHFHSFDGSVLFGRYPHTFFSMDGTLDATGQVIHENYGFTARSISPAILSGPVKHTISVEKEKYLHSTNRHFSVTIDDATYWRIRREVDEWRDLPGAGYDLDRRNCIHFVGAIAGIVGLNVEYPEQLLRKPKAWLNRVTRQNPELNAAPID